MLQRVAAGVAILAGAWLMIAGIDAMDTVGGAEGATILSADSPISALGQLLSVSLVLVLVAAIVGAMGNPLAGVFSLMAALAIKAWTRGPIDEWLRLAESSAAYWVLVAESLLWLVLVWIAAVSILRLSNRLKRVLPEPAGDADADDTPESKSDDSAYAQLGHFHAGIEKLTKQTGQPATRLLGLLAGVTCFVLGLLLTALLLQSTAVNQVFWGVGFAFVIAGVVAHQFFPTPRGLGILLSPMCVAMVWYTWAAMAGGSRVDLLEAYFQDQFVNGALALPVVYASAGVAGAAMGIGWSQVLIRTQLAEQATTSGEVESA